MRMKRFDSGVDAMHAGDVGTGCTHAGFHSTTARYASDRQEIRYVTVCDACAAEIREVHRDAYVPAYDPRGNDPYLRAARA
jgi:hypothetical protein